MDWVDLAEDEDEWPNVVRTALNCLIPQNAESYFSSREHYDLSSRSLRHVFSYTDVKLFSLVRPVSPP